ncbi:hypothetical protein [Mammaliicoccus vitulinus]|uniref:Uncharacterized protein n=1 Tax=Mammaliicoccus vitulinus TaxID=71237 RepID=A0ABX7HBZ2_9STAP|nr:hypothetical protein [Mammaliicoccus vitulinus]MEB7657117.1 hypothetical protein [Mammaliicoccus vitulinus]PNZ40608.1 hypothetical protein CD107_01680 [Mammaliicoccus vitulinus]QRO84174.1 hypothetical protein I6J37_08040 [Mammaliicoccus vitulinus]QTN11435.1 hypothetical protein G7A42_06035 [Mammaliicoccus vitulinus]WQK88564.1 hypothetical protein P3U62_03260 [Mammaliicoccus vitulinus]
MKRISLIISCLILLLTCQTVAKAQGNTGDTYWKNEFRIWSPYDHTPARKKLNTSAYYNKNYGTVSENSRRIRGMYIWAALYDGRDVSNGHSYWVTRGQVTKLYNLAVEKYGSGVAVRIDAKSYSNGYFNGVWSPDSK